MGNSVFHSYFIKDFQRVQKLKPDDEFGPNDDDYFNIHMSFSQRTNIEHRKLQIIESLGQLGSYLSLIFSIWGFATMFLKIKHMNRQSELVELYEHYKLNPTAQIEEKKEKKRLCHSCSLSELLSWVWQTKKQF
jgi:hypothetical protein